MTIADFLSSGAIRLAGVSSSPAIDAQMLAAHVLRADRSYVLAHPETELPELAMEVLLQRRETGEPLAYILGWREFYGRKFTVRPGVLIPRQDTEVVVEACLELRPNLKVLDVGTGSGIIAVTLKLERPDWQVFASDISPDALSVARQNAEEQGAEVAFVESDLFGAFGAETFDLIVSNPPYIGCHEDLPLEVDAYEPHEALYSGETGNELYQRIAEEAPSRLLPGGKLVMELGYQSLPQVAATLSESGWSIESVRRDLSGIDRCIVASR